MRIQQNLKIILDEIQQILSSINSEEVKELVEEIINSRQIFCGGVGREGLMLKAFSMRLMHLGLESYVVGDVTTPPIHEKDLLIVSAGPGYIATVEVMVDIAKRSGARIALVTAEPDQKLAKKADFILNIPAQTMAEEVGDRDSLQPMGCSFEQSQLMLFDLIVLDLMEKLGEDDKSMSLRHTNLE